MSEKKIEKIVTADVKPHKTFARSLIAGDVKDIWESIRGDVVVPSLKRLILDILNNGGEMLLYGNVTGRATTSTAKPAYSKISSQGKMSISSTRPSDATPVTLSHDYENIIFETREYVTSQAARIEANKVLAKMVDTIDQYDVVSLCDLYDMLGWPSTYTDNKYGWYSLGEARVEETRNGYCLRLPKVRPIT